MSKTSFKTLLASFGAGCALLSAAVNHAVAAEEPQPNAAEWVEASGYKMLVRKPVRFDRTGERIDELVAKMPAVPAASQPKAPKEIPNKFRTGLPDVEEPLTLERDPLSLYEPTRAAPSVDVSVPGPGSDDNQSLFGFRIAPPDTNGDVGREFVVSYINLVWSYYDKTGAQLGGPFPGNSFWAGFGGDCETENSGDPIVLYDHMADRWVFSQFAVNSTPYLQCFAISETNDPAGPYVRYAYEIVPGDFNDYPKIGIWSDGADQSAYHATIRQFTNGQFFAGIDAVAFDRDAMLAGDPSASFVTFRINTNAVPDGIMPIHLDGGPTPPAGSCGLYGAAINGNPDGYGFWELCVDWNNPGNSTFASKGTVTNGVPSWNGVGSIPQPSGGNALDDLDFFTAYRFSARYFPDTGLKGLLSHTVNAGGGTAGIRWAEFDLDDTNAITVNDTGTVGGSDGLHRWMGAATFDKVGNIGLAFSVSNSSTFPGVNFTGRETTDPAGTMQADSVCVEGTGVQTGVSRWGDYSSTSVDPVDECTFWTFQEYVAVTGTFDWDTRICSFSFPSCTGNGGGDENEPPVADAGADITIAPRSNATLDGTGSFDTDGTIVSYSWTTSDGRALRIRDADTATPRVRSSARITATTVVDVTLTVTDDEGATATDVMSVTIQP